MQKPVGLCFVHQGSTFWHVVQNRARHDNSKVQRFDSNGSYEFSNALSSYPGCSKIKKYFLLFPHEGCANPQPKEPFFPLHVFGCVQCNLWSRFFLFLQVVLGYRPSDTDGKSIWKWFHLLVPISTRSTALHAIEIFPDPESRRQVNIALRQFRNSGFSIFFDLVYLVNPRYD